MILASTSREIDQYLEKEQQSGENREYNVSHILLSLPEAASPGQLEEVEAKARDIVQRARGVAATVVNGEILLRDGKPTGARPGQLLRGPLARRR